ncbi:MAG: DNA topoisomerase 3, partial [Defluviitaleaceae bacterium]|nr:DNA topoisomerase 3 [Defluviitaleaceae bacterium]
MVFMKTLVVAEKPSVGREIARVLGCRQKGEGFLYGVDYVVSWAIGHLATLCEPEDYDEKFKRWNLAHLPIIPDDLRPKVIPKTKQQMNVLKNLMNSNEIGSVVNAADSGREGELIFRYIYSLAKCKKPVKRLWISSMTDAAIKEGFAKLKDGGEYDALYVSAKCRAGADWLVGINATRAYTVTNKEIFSVGRVQTPTLAIIVAKRREIEAFKPEDYFEVRAEFITEKSGDASGEIFYSGTYVSPQSETKINGRAEAESIAETVKDQAGCVESALSEQKRRLPPQLFDLTELQRESNRVLGMTAAKTLSIAQSLYEKHKLITYPRTDSRYISRDMVPKLTQIVNALSETEPENISKTVASINAAAKRLQELKSLPVTGRIADDSKVSDHHAIIPTGLKKSLASLSPDERAVYERIALNFLAAFHPAHVYDSITVVTEVRGHRFVSRGSAVVEEGWRALYRSEAPDKSKARAKAGSDEGGGAESEAEDGVLKMLCAGDSVTARAAQALKKQTQPPKPYTEASLLSAMENAGRFIEDEALREKLKDSGLGTPATRAATIERLIEVGYVTRRQKNLDATEKGVRIIDMVPVELKSPETTGKWERALSRIA